MTRASTKSLEIRTNGTRTHIKGLQVYRNQLKCFLSKHVIHEIDLHDGINSVCIKAEKRTDRCIESRKCRQKSFRKFTERKLISSDLANILDASCPDSTNNQNLQMGGYLLLPGDFRLKAGKLERAMHIILFVTCEFQSSQVVKSSVDTTYTVQSSLQECP